MCVVESHREAISLAQSAAACHIVFNWLIILDRSYWSTGTYSPPWHFWSEAVVELSCCHVSNHFMKGIRSPTYPATCMHPPGHSFHRTAVFHKARQSYCSIYQAITVFWGSALEGGLKGEVTFFQLDTNIQNTNRQVVLTLAAFSKLPDSAFSGSLHTYAL